LGTSLDQSPDHLRENSYAGIDDPKIMCPKAFQFSFQRKIDHGEEFLRERVLFLHYIFFLKKKIKLSLMNSSLSFTWALRAYLYRHCSGQAVSSSGTEAHESPAKRD